jgi:hypothetical protein
MITTCYAPIRKTIPYVELTVNATAYTIVRCPSASSQAALELTVTKSLLRDAETRAVAASKEAASLRLSKEEGEAALRAANERICNAELQATSALSNLDAAVADHKSLVASLTKAFGSARSETAAAQALAEQYRLIKCKAVADQQQATAVHSRTIDRITAQLQLVSTTADDLRSKQRRAEETIAALRAELKVQQAKPVISASTSPSKSASRSPRISLSRRLSSAASAPIIDAPPPPPASVPSPVSPSPVSTSLPSLNHPSSRDQPPTPASSPTPESPSPASPDRVDAHKRSLS